MKKFVLETIDFTSIFKGYRIPIPFFLLCIGRSIFCKNQPTFANYTLISPPIWEPFLFYIGRGNFEGHLWLPYYIKRLFYNGFRAKVKWLYEGRRFSTPPEPLPDGRNIGNSVLLWYLVKSIYDRVKIFFNFFLHFGYKKYTNKSLYRWCFQCF